MRVKQNSVKNSHLTRHSDYGMQRVYLENNVTQIPEECPLRKRVVQAVQGLRVAPPIRRQSEQRAGRLAIMPGFGNNLVSALTACRQ